MQITQYDYFLKLILIRRILSEKNFSTIYALFSQLISITKNKNGFFYKMLFSTFLQININKKA